MPTSNESVKTIPLSELSQAISKALAAGKGQEEIILYLANHGWTEESARDMVVGIARGQEPGQEPPDVPTSGEEVISRPFVSRSAGAVAPACSICGRQDETLRIVSYPFVVSLIVVTFRRAFSGLWCAKHRRRFIALASLITATTGWLGIPFGLIFTPIALFGLAKGGEQPRDKNAAMLKMLAAHKLDAGNIAGAVRSLEASMRFDSEGLARERLAQIRSAHTLLEQQPEGCQQEMLAVVKVLFSAIAIGAAIGGLDYLSTFLFQILAPGDVPLLVGILSWTPLIAGTFVGGVSLAQKVEDVLTQVRCCSLTLSLSLSILAAIMAVYSIAQVAAVADFLLALTQGGFASTADMVFDALLIFILGGSLWIVGAITTEGPSNTIYLAVMTAAVVYYLWIAVRAAIQTTHWQQSIAN